MEECTICMEVLINTTRTTTECNHTYHTKCLDIWMKRNSNCPLCRRKLSIAKKGILGIRLWHF